MCFFASFPRLCPWAIDGGHNPLSPTESSIRRDGAGRVDSTMSQGEKKRTMASQRRLVSGCGRDGPGDSPPGREGDGGRDWRQPLQGWGLSTVVGRLAVEPRPICANLSPPPPPNHGRRLHCHVDYSMPRAETCSLFSSGALFMAPPSSDGSRSRGSRGPTRGPRPGRRWQKGITGTNRHSDQEQHWEWRVRVHCREVLQMQVVVVCGADRNVCRRLHAATPQTPTTGEPGTAASTRPG